MKHSRNSQHLLPGLLAASVVAIAGCSTSSESQGRSSQALSGSPYSIMRAGNRYASDTGDSWYDSVQQTIGSRCAVCHSCTNGPCQLNMTSYAALSRGVSATNPYSHGLFDGVATRVADNLPVSYWRGIGFTSVLPDNAKTPNDSIFFRALELGKQNIPPDVETSGPFSIDNVRALAVAHDEGNYVCPASGARYRDLTYKYPMGGMPWGLPAVDDAKLGVLEQWVLGGANGPSAAAVAKIQAPQTTFMSQMDPVQLVGRWEAFLNGRSNESQLVGRYIYEHAFQANLHLSENPGEYYRLVRSWSAFPAPIQQILTDTAADYPGGTGRVYYRMQKIDRLIEGKTQVTWQRSLADLSHMQQQFFGTAWSAEGPPDYSSPNPFKYFEAIPAVARDRFMIENSRVIFQQFARGPVCLVQSASYAVNEHHWLWFLKPESDPSVQTPMLGLDSYDSFFPTKTDDLLNGIPAMPDKEGEGYYRTAFETTLRSMKPQGLDVTDIWDGDGTNPNAWLTNHRNQVSDDVTNGSQHPVTGTPRAVWLLSYANFERMYYNATVQYKYWAGLGYQADTFNWQTYERTEAEDLYVSLFPDQNFRSTLRSKFTTYEGMLYNELFTDYSQGRPAPGNYADEDSLQRAVFNYMGPSVIVSPDRLNHWPSDPGPSVIASSIGSTEDFEAGLRTLTAHTAPYARFFPNVVHVRIAGQYLYTLLADRAYFPNKVPTSEAGARDPANDQVVAIAGFAGFESHLFVDLTWDNAADFLNGLANVTTSDQFQALRSQYAIPRNDSRFWPFVDWLNGWMEQNMPVEAGLLELRFYDKDVVPF